MPMWMLLMVVLSAGQTTQTQPTGDARAQAEELAKSGAYRAALERFQAIAAANPDDIDARLWIARLYGSLGDNRRALDVYQSIVATSPQHLEALLGLGRTFIALGRLTEAADVLARAESLAAENVAVLAAQGRIHAAAGRTMLALAYYNRALTINPGDEVVRREYDELRASRAHRVELGYFLEHFNTDVPDPQAGSGTINARLSESVRLLGTVQHQRKFSRSETRGGGGIEWALRHNLRIHGGLFIGDDVEIFPEADGYGELDYTWGRATWSFNLRFADFQAADVNIGGGGLRIALPPQSSVWVRYYRFSTDYEFASSDIVHSWVLGGAGQPRPEWVLGAEYTRGPDQLDMLTADRLGQFETNTYSAFTELFFSPMTSAVARYDYQDRPTDVRMHRLTIRLVHRF
jgi:YaiO family outer membrane protein